VFAWICAYVSVAFVGSFQAVSWTWLFGKKLGPNVDEKDSRRLRVIKVRIVASYVVASLTAVIAIAAIYRGSIGKDTVDAVGSVILFLIVLLACVQAAMLNRVTSSLAARSVGGG
jgi:hypothetical protein